MSVAWSICGCTWRDAFPEERAHRFVARYQALGALPSALGHPLVSALPPGYRCAVSQLLQPRTCFPGGSSSLGALSACKYRETKEWCKHVVLFGFGGVFLCGWLVHWLMKGRDWLHGILVYLFERVGISFAKVEGKVLRNTRYYWMTKPNFLNRKGKYLKSSI